ncbi:hypothetical protein CFP56_015892 [Quercus suber]|uniref:Uncharacterized protein n=1 Tax=Quercus suber TaxID=58331 RepID=A0AAW0M4Q4_QUESU
MAILPNRVDQEHRLNNSNRRVGNKLWSGKMHEVEAALVESCGRSSSFEKSCSPSSSLLPSRKT